MRWGNILKSAFAAAAVGLLPMTLWLTTPLLSIPPLGPIVIGSLLILPYATFRWKLDRKVVLFVSLISSVGIGLLSVTTGLWNNLTTERYAIPIAGHMLWAGQNPYAVLHIIPGTNWPPEYLWELPLTGVLAWPGNDYAWPMLVSWVLMVYVLRKRYSGLVMAQPLVALLAANGYSDFFPLLLLSVAYAAKCGKGCWLAEAVSAATKQFATAITIIRSLLRRDYKRAILLAGWVTAISLPFLLWNPTMFLCNAVVFQTAPGCPVPPGAIRGGGVWPGITNVNYSLWLVWIVGMWPIEVRSLLHRIGIRKILRRDPAHPPA